MSLDEYMSNRRFSRGIQLSIAMFAFVRGINLDELVKQHGWLGELIHTSADINGLLNDIISYPKELKAYQKILIKGQSQLIIFI